MGKRVTTLHRVATVVGSCNVVVTRHCLIVLEAPQERFAVQYLPTSVPFGPSLLRPSK